MKIPAIPIPITHPASKITFANDKPPDLQPVSSLPLLAFAAFRCNRSHTAHLVLFVVTVFVLYEGKHPF